MVEKMKLLAKNGLSKGMKNIYEWNSWNFLKRKIIPRAPSTFVSKVFGVGSEGPNTF